MARFIATRTGRDTSSWPVLLLLPAAIVPLAGMAWMLRAALESEQLAVRQRLADAYRVHLERASTDVSANWEALLGALSRAAVERTPAEAFQWCVVHGNADSVIVWDDAGQAVYPMAAATAKPVERDEAWIAAERLEFGELNVAAAAERYRAIAAEAGDERTRALAEQAWARCLLKLNRHEPAVEVLQRLRTLSSLTDGHGRSIAADAELRLLEISDLGSTEGRELATSLAARLNRYSEDVLPADQRRFIMQRVAELSLAEDAGAKSRFPTMAAENLAAEFLATKPERQNRQELRREAAGVWSLTTREGRVTALFRRERVERIIRDVLKGQSTPLGVSLVVREPGEAAAEDNQVMATTLSPAMPGWRLAMLADGGEVFDQAASRRRALLITIGAVMVGATAAMLWLATSGMRRQLQVARLKNDLVATVSHELKTPLASTRLLVDSLLEQEAGINGRTREYLEMISHENARLTRLIDNFLTFSRLERGKQRFSFELIDGREIIAGAVAAVRDRFDGSDAKLEAEVEGPLWIRGDVEALVTAVINLIDNAWKYSGERKRVVVRGRAAGECVVIQVEDNGIGLAPRAVKRVFERFYQVDQQLARTQGGCGLGLSIVKSIVDAHGGLVSVQSLPGAGSTFMISLPAEGYGESLAAEAEREVNANVSVGGKAT